MKYLVLALLCLSVSSCETFSLSLAGDGYGVSYSRTGGILVTVQPPLKPAK